jgi:hypothetical protein
MPRVSTGSDPYGMGHKRHGPFGKNELLAHHQTEELTITSTTCQRAVTPSTVPTNVTIASAKDATARYQFCVREIL